MFLGMFGVILGVFLSLLPLGLPGGNQVDGLPPAASLRASIPESALRRRVVNLVWGRRRGLGGWFWQRSGGAPPGRLALHVPEWPVSSCFPDKACGKLVLLVVLCRKLLLSVVFVGSSFPPSHFV